MAEMLVPDLNKELAFFTAPMHLMSSMEVKSCFTLDLQREDFRFACYGEKVDAKKVETEEKRVV